MHNCTTVAAVPQISPAHDSESHGLEDPDRSPFVGLNPHHPYSHNTTAGPYHRHLTRCIQFWYPVSTSSSNTAPKDTPQVLGN